MRIKFCLSIVMLAFSLLSALLNKKIVRLTETRPIQKTRPIRLVLADFFSVLAEFVIGLMWADLVMIKVFNS